MLFSLRNERRTEGHRPDDSEVFSALMVVDKFCRAVFDIKHGPKPLSALPCDPEKVEESAIFVLQSLKHPGSLEAVTSLVPDSALDYIYKPEFAPALKANLVGNLPNFMPEEDANFFRYIIRKLKVSAPLSDSESKRSMALAKKKRDHRERILARLRKEGLASAELEKLASSL